MSLSDRANVSSELRRVINDAFEVDHPFKKSSGQLQDFVRSFHEIRQLPLEDFSMCFEAIHEVLVLNNHCNGCYGKGLAYLKLLTQGVDDARHTKASRDYAGFANLRDWSSDFEQSVLEVMAKNGVEPYKPPTSRTAQRAPARKTNFHMPDDLCFPEVFTGFFQSLKLDWSGNSLENAIVSLSSGPGQRLPDGTKIPQRPMCIVQAEATSPGYSSFRKKARELLNKKGHPTSDHITDALLCATVFAESDGEKRRNFLNSCIAKIRPVHVSHFFVTRVVPDIDRCSFFGYQIGPIHFERFASRCGRIGTDFVRLYGKEIEGRLALESPEFQRNWVDFLDATKNRLSLRLNSVWLELELLYYEGLAREHFEMMWSHFDRVQALRCALGKGGVDPLIFRQRLAQNSHQIAIYLSAHGKERGYIAPVQLGLIMEGKIPSTSTQEEKYFQAEDSELGAVIMECSSLLQQAGRFLAANRSDDAALYATIALERIFSERGDVTDSIARRTALVCHRIRNLSFAKCRGELHSLYNARSRFVHGNVSIAQEKAEALLKYARWVLCAMFSLQENNRTAADGFLGNWIQLIDAAVESAGDESKISDTTLSELGALPAPSGDPTDEKILE